MAKTAMIIEERTGNFTKFEMTNYFFIVFILPKFNENVTKKKLMNDTP